MASRLTAEQRRRQRLRERGIKAKEARELVDSEAAAVLLQSWLDARQSRS